MNVEKIAKILYCGALIGSGTHIGTGLLFGGQAKNIPEDLVRGGGVGVSFSGVYVAYKLLTESTY